MEQSCCRLGSAITQDRVLYATPNFFVMPTLGSIGIEGYLLIIPKKHFLGVGAIPENLRPELTEIIEDTRKLIKSEYKKPILIFEHGPRIGKLQSGTSIDHAHLHVVPGIDITTDWSVDLMSRLGELGMFYRVERIQGFDKAQEILENGNSYLYMETPEGVRLISQQNFHRPPQYFRKMVASHVDPKRWNWKKYPCEETLDKTVERLKGKF